MIEISKAMIRDVGHVTTLEVWTQEFARTSDKIKACFTESESEVYLAQIGRRHVGYATANFDRQDGAVTVTAIGVHREFRKNGVARKVLDRIELEAKSLNIDTVRMLVPSYLIEDQDDPWNIEQWLWKVSFVAKGAEGGCYRYGHEYDYYIFERQHDTQASGGEGESVC